MKKLLLLLLSFTVLSFQVGKNIQVNIDNAKQTNILMSDLFQKVEYVPLELNNNSILGDFINVSIRHEMLVVVDFKKAHLYNRNSGKHIREISGRGQGPDEYIFHPVYYDERNDLLVTNNHKNWRFIDVETNKTKITVEKPARIYKNENKHQGIISNPYIYDANTFIGYTNNVTGTYPDILSVFTKEGKILKTFPNYNFYEKKSRDMPSSPGEFYQINNNIYFRAFSSDTVFLVKDQLYPHIIFSKKANNEKMKYENVKIAGEIFVVEKRPDDYQTIWYVNESKDYVFFSIKTRSDFRACYYDKKANKTYAPLNNKAGFTNDIDGLPDFHPLWISGEELIGYYRPQDLTTYKGKKNLSRKAQQLLDNLQEDDNPIVVIAKIKK